MYILSPLKKKNEMLKISQSYVVEPLEPGSLGAASGSPTNQWYDLKQIKLFVPLVKEY